MMSAIRRAASLACGIQVGCSITKRYMSLIHRAPSGPVRTIDGRNQLSVDARNSLSRSLSGRRLVNVAPSADTISRCTRLCTGSQTNELP